MIPLDKDIRHKSGIRGGRGYFGRYLRALEMAVADNDPESARKLGTIIAHEGRLELAYRRRVSTQAENRRRATLARVQQMVDSFGRWMTEAEAKGDVDDFVCCAENYEDVCYRLAGLL